MADTFTAYGVPTWTTSDGIEAESRVAQYDTPGTISGSSAQSADTYTRLITIGGVERPVLEGGLRIPIGKPLPADNWEFECIEVGPDSDPSLVGRRWRVVSTPAKSYATARRLDVVEVPQEA